jgi:hypothetical protein
VHYIRKNIAHNSHSNGKKPKYFEVSVAITSRLQSCHYNYMGDFSMGKKDGGTPFGIKFSE